MDVLIKNKPSHIPIRTCIVCGEKKPKRELMRLALDPDHLVVFDPSQKMTGRGAYVCHGCIHNLKWNKKLEKAFRGRAKALGISNVQPE